MGFNPVTGLAISSNGDDSEMITNYEKRIAEMLMTIQKQERDILYKNEEIRSIKNIARDVAAELEPVKQREIEFKTEISARDEVISGMTHKMEEMAKRIEELKKMLNDESR